MPPPWTCPPPCRGTELPQRGWQRQRRPSWSGWTGHHLTPNEKTNERSGAAAAAPSACACACACALRAAVELLPVRGLFLALVFLRKIPNPGPRAPRRGWEPNRLVGNDYFCPYDVHKGSKRKKFLTTLLGIHKLVLPRNRFYQN